MHAEKHNYEKSKRAFKYTVREIVTIYVYRKVFNIF